MIVNRNAHYVHSQFCLGLTAVAYRWKTWNVLFIQQIKTSAWIHICIWMNSWSHIHIQDRQNLKWRHNSGKLSQLSPFLNKWAQSRLVLSITVKQLTMTLKALLASAECAFVACISELERMCPRDYTDGSSGLRWTEIISPSPSLWVH